MIKVDEYEMIRTAHRVHSKSIRYLAREYGHHRETIRRVLQGLPPEYRRRNEPDNPVMGPYQTVIDAILLDDRQRPKKQRHTAKRIFNRLVKEHDFPGCCSAARRFVRLRKAALGFLPAEAMVPCLSCGTAGNVSGWSHACF